MNFNTQREQNIEHMRLYIAQFENYFSSIRDNYGNKGNNLQGKYFF